MINRRQMIQSIAMAGALGVPIGRRGRAIGDEPGEGWPDSPFLKGNYGPVFEEIEATDLKVIGSIPQGLDGMFLRNGPNPQFAPIGNYHWFDGDGMLHGVLLRDGKASYRNRWVRTQGFVDEREEGKAIWGGLTDPPNPGLMAQGKPMFKNAANTALVWHDGKLLALWEGGEPYEISAPSLETVGPLDFGGNLSHPFTAHPKIDPVSGDMFCFGYQPVRPFLKYSVVGADGTIRSTSAIDLPRPVMMHDFAITEHYAIFMDLPATFNFMRMLSGGPFLSFEPERGARFGIMPRDGSGEIRWFESPPCYVFHTLNAFEDGDEVVLVACRYGRFPGSLGMGGPPVDGRPDAPGEDEAPRLHRWRFNLATGATTEETLDDRPVEFPRINETMTGRASRFGYLMDGDMSGFVKVDLSDGGQTVRHRFGEGKLGGEGVFVPRPDSTGEDEGWIITFVYDRASETSEMVVVDAKGFDGDPVARVIIPARVPFGFHGTWLPGDLLG